MFCRYRKVQPESEYNNGFKSRGKYMRKSAGMEEKDESSKHTYNWFLDSNDDFLCIFCTEFKIKYNHGSKEEDKLAEFRNSIDGRITGSLYFGLYRSWI